MPYDDEEQQDEWGWGGGPLLSPPVPPRPAQQPGTAVAPTEGPRLLPVPGLFDRTGPFAAFSPSDPTGRYSGIRGFLASPLFQTLAESLAVGLAGLRNTRDQGRFQEALMQQIQTRRAERASLAAQQETLASVASINQLVAQGKYAEAQAQVSDMLNRIRMGQMPTTPEMLTYLARMDASLAAEAAKRGERREQAENIGRLVAPSLGYKTPEEIQSFTEQMRGVDPQYLQTILPVLIKQNRGLSPAEHVRILASPFGMASVQAGLNPYEAFGALHAASQPGATPVDQARAATVMSTVAPFLSKDKLPDLRKETVETLGKLGYNPDETRKLLYSPNPEDRVKAQERLLAVQEYEQALERARAFDQSMQRHLATTAANRELTLNEARALGVVKGDYFSVNPKDNFATAPGSMKLGQVANNPKYVGVDKETEQTVRSLTDAVKNLEDLQEIGKKFLKLSGLQTAGHAFMTKVLAILQDPKTPEEKEARRLLAEFRSKATDVFTLARAAGNDAKISNADQAIASLFTGSRDSWEQWFLSLDEFEGATGRAHRLLKNKILRRLGQTTGPDPDFIVAPKTTSSGVIQGVTPGVTIKPANPGGR